MYIEYIWFGLVGFYGISNIVGYLMPNPLYIYMSIHVYRIYMIWFGLVLGHINHCRLFNAKFSIYIYIKFVYKVFSHILLITYLSEPELFFAHSWIFLSIEI